MLPRTLRSRVKVLLCSHDPTVNQGKPLDLSPWVVQCSVTKHIRGEGQLSFVLVPRGDAGSWLDVIRPDDVVNVYMSSGESGDVRVMFGYVDAIQRSTEVLPQTGAVRTRYLVQGTDFTKALRLTHIYFNPWAAETIAPQLGEDAAAGASLRDNVAGAELLRQGLRWFGTPADIVESHLLVLLGYQAQWRLPPSYPDIPAALQGNVFTGATDTRDDVAHLRLVLDHRVVGPASVDAPGARLQRLADPEGPPNPTSYGFVHPLQNGAPLTGGRTPHFLAERPNRGPHLGVDITAGPGTPVHPVAPGVIVHLDFRRREAHRSPDAGNFVVLRHELGGVVFHSRYMHLQDWYREGHDLDAPGGPDLLLLNRHPTEGSSDPDEADFTPAGRPWRVGDRVTPVDVLAFSGDTGNARGFPHLHLELAYQRRRPYGTTEEVFIDPQRFIPGLTGGPARPGAAPAPGRSAGALLDEVLRYRRGRRELRTLLDVLDRSYIERAHIDGFMASEQMLSESGNLLALLQAHSNECMNELFFDLRLADRASPDPVRADELGGNVDEAGAVTAPCYVPAVVMREYPFTTLSRATYPSSSVLTESRPVASAAPGMPGASGGVLMGETPVSAALSGPVYGLPDNPGVFFSSRERPVRVAPVRPITTETPSSTRQPATEVEQARAQAGSFRYMDTAVLTLDRVLRMDVGRSDYDYFNVIDLRSSDLQADLKYLCRGVTPLVAYDSLVVHGLRLREIYSTFTQMGLSASDASLRKTLARWALLNDHWHQHANQYLAGTIECLPLLDCRVGYRLDVPELDECYYVEGVRHDWSLAPDGRSSMRTTLTVTRGQPMIRRPGEPVLHQPAPGTSPAGYLDSMGIDPQGGDRVLAGGQTVYEIASAVSARKPPTPPAPPGTRRGLGLRYFALAGSRERMSLAMNRGPARNT